MDSVLGLLRDLESDEVIYLGDRCDVLQLERLSEWRADKLY